MRRRSFAHVVELEVGETLAIGAVSVTATVAEHGGKRGPFASGAALGYLVEGSSRVYFAGDTDLFAGMADLGALKRTLARVRRTLSAIPALQVETESPREGYLQTLLSRGDRRVADVLERLQAAPDDWWATLRVLRGGRGDTVDPDRFVHRAWDADELLPWDFIDHGVEKRYLLAERRKAHAELQSPPCDTHTCHSCGAC